MFTPLPKVEGEKTINKDSIFTLQQKNAIIGVMRWMWDAIFTDAQEHGLYNEYNEIRHPVVNGLSNWLLKFMIAEHNQRRTKMGLDINIKTDNNIASIYYCDQTIWLNGRSTYNELVFDILKITDEQYGKDIPLTKEQAISVCQYIADRNVYAAQKLALWIVLDFPITFQADW